MIFIIADKPLEGMIEEHLPPMCDLRDYFSGITGHDLPPIAGRDMEGWMPDLPLRPDGGRWGLPRWGVPPICRPILRQGAVELVNYTNDGFIVSLKASTGLDLDWNCYVNQHDSGYGGSRLRPFVSILFAYWYLPLAGLLQPEPPGLEAPEQHRDPVGMYRDPPRVGDMRQMRLLHNHGRPAAQIRDG